MNLASISRILFRKIPVETEPQNFCSVWKLKIKRLQLMVGLRIIQINQLGGFRGRAEPVFSVERLKMLMLLFLKIVLKNKSARKP